MSTVGTGNHNFMVYKGKNTDLKEKCDVSEIIHWINLVLISLFIFFDIQTSIRKKTKHFTRNIVHIRIVSHNLN